MDRLARYAALAAVLTSLALSACGGGGGSSSSSVGGVSTPSSVSVVTATNDSN